MFKENESKLIRHLKKVRVVFPFNASCICIMNERGGRRANKQGFFFSPICRQMSPLTPLHHQRRQGGSRGGEIALVTLKVIPSAMLTIGVLHHIFCLSVYLSVSLSFLSLVSSVSTSTFFSMSVSVYLLCLSIFLSLYASLCFYLSSLFRLLLCKE